MRTTVTLDDDVAAAVERARLEHGEDLSSVINRLVRRGLRTPEATVASEQPNRGLGLRIDVTNVAEALELLDGPTRR